MNKQKEQDDKDAKKKKKEKKQKEQVEREHRVSPRRQQAPMQQLSAVRKHRAKHATSATDTMTLLEQVEEQLQALGRNPRFLARHPVPPSKTSVKQATKPLAW